MNKTMRAVRGGIGVSEDSRDAIGEATIGLINAIVESNDLNHTDIECLWFTVTPDLRSEIPPLALRERGDLEIPALCAVEADWSGHPRHTIRVLALAHFPAEAVVKHVFQNGASRDRPIAME